MKIALFTNIASPHQIPLGKALAKQLGSQFSLVCWEPIDNERKSLGWTENPEFEWLLQAWDSKSSYSKALDLINTADVVICGYAPVSLINKRVEEGKLTFRYTERIFKHGRWILLDPRITQGIYKIIKFSNLENYHLLSVGPFCAEDYRFLHAFKNRMWRWGYFPEMPENIEKKTTTDIITILWAGRMLPLKRVDLLLRAAAWTKANGSKPFLLRIIGNGLEEKHLKELAGQLGLRDVCKFEAPMSPKEIGLEMDKADIYVLPSDQNEGWGVVVNEAMSHGCCVIGAKNVGSVPWLIQNGVNGYIFENNSPEELGKLLQMNINDQEKCHNVGIAGRKTMDLWSPTTAADRLLNMCQTIIDGGLPQYADGGPCSPA